MNGRLRSETLSANAWLSTAGHIAEEERHEGVLSKVAQSNGSNLYECDKSLRDGRQTTLGMALDSVTSVGQLLL